jgi:hypothetical protein
MAIIILIIAVIQDMVITVMMKKINGGNFGNFLKETVNPKFENSTSITFALKHQKNVPISRDS